MLSSGYKVNADSCLMKGLGGGVVAIPDMTCPGINGSILEYNGMGSNLLWDRLVYIDMDRDTADARERHHTLL